MKPRDWFGVVPAPNGDEGIAEITELLALDGASLELVEVHTYGLGTSEFSADLILSDGRTLRLDELRKLSARQLIRDLAAITGVAPAGIKEIDIVRLISLLRAIGDHHQTVGEDEISREWGVDFLREYDEVDVDLSSQTSRWAAFSKARTEVVVLCANDGMRLVRRGDFHEFVRVRDPRVAQARIALRMERLGWTSRTSTNRFGAVKATPTMPGAKPFVLRFYFVPAGWEDAEQ